MEVLFSILIILLIIGDGYLFYRKANNANKKHYLQFIFAALGAILCIVFGELLIEILNTINRNIVRHLLGFLNDSLFSFIFYLIGSGINLLVLNKIIRNKVA